MGNKEKSGRKLTAGPKKGGTRRKSTPNTTVKTSVTIVSLAPLSGQDREEELRRVDKAGDAVTRSCRNPTLALLTLNLERPFSHDLRSNL